jgi:hypothetical protein
MSRKMVTKDRLPLGEDIKDACRIFTRVKKGGTGKGGKQVPGL